MKGLMAELRSLPLTTLLPVRRWLRDKPWNVIWIRWFAVFAIAPLALLHYWQEEVSIFSVAWAFGLYFGCLWAVVLHQGLRLPWKAWAPALGIAAITSFFGTLAVAIGQALPGMRDLYVATSSEVIAARALGFVLGVGLLEETVKASPIVWLVLYRRKRPTTPAEAAFLGVVSGVAFGVAEAIPYSVSYSLSLAQGEMEPGQHLVIQLVRLITLPLLHGLWTALVGYFVAFAAAVPARSRALVVVAVAMTAVLHGLYDVAVGTWFAVEILLLSLLLFVGYARSAEQIVHELARVPQGGSDTEPSSQDEAPTSLAQEPPQTVNTLRGTKEEAVMQNAIAVPAPCAACNGYGKNAEGRDCPRCWGTGRAPDGAC